MEDRQLTVVASVYCEIASLVPGDISDILETSPGLRQRLESYGEMRMVIESKVRAARSTIVPLDYSQDY